MKIIITTTKTDDFTTAGEIIIFNNITKMVDKTDVVELIRNGKYAGVINKDRNRIIDIEW